MKNEDSIVSKYTHESLYFRCAKCGVELFFTPNINIPSIDIHPCYKCTKEASKIIDRMEDFINSVRKKESI